MEGRTGNYNEKNSSRLQLPSLKKVYIPESGLKLSQREELKKRLERRKFLLGNTNSSAANGLTYRKHLA